MSMLTSVYIAHTRECSNASVGNMVVPVDVEVHIGGALSPVPGNILTVRRSSWKRRALVGSDRRLLRTRHAHKGTHSAERNCRLLKSVNGIGA